jgi:hypothetical protein
VDECDAGPPVTLLLSLSLHRFLSPLFTGPMDPFTSLHEQDQISPDEASQVIVSALADPASVPLACLNILIYSYMVLLRIWTDPVYNENIRPLIRRYRDVLCCSMRFLCSFRSAEQFRVLKQTLERGPCRCARGPDVLHNLISPSHHRNLIVPGAVRIPHLLSTMISMLNSALSDQDWLIMKKLYKATRRRLWPASVNDLLPHGSASFHNLLRWLPQVKVDTSQQAPYNLLVCNIFEAMPSYLRAGFMKGPVMVDWLHQAIIRWKMEPVDVQAEELSPAIMFTGPFFHAARYLSEDEIFLWLSGSPRHSIQDMFTALDRALGMLIHYPSYAASDEHVRMLRGSYTIIHDYLVLSNRSDLRFTPSMYTLSGIQEFLRMRRIDPVARLGRTAFGSNWNQRCYGPGCIATYVDRTKTFKGCSGCRTAIYCSRKCQKAAWRHPKAAHREVCGLYRACKDAMLPHERDINEAICTRAWEAVPPQQLNAASANIQNLRATQLVCLSTCSLISDLPRHDLIFLAEEEMDGIPTDEL